VSCPLPQYLQGSYNAHQIPSINRRYSDLVGAYLFRHVVLKVDPARLGEFLRLVDANPRLPEYCLVLELWLDQYTVRELAIDAIQAEIIHRLPRVQKLILNSAATTLRRKDGSVQTITRRIIGLPLNETLSTMWGATWITSLVLAPSYDQGWSLQVFNAFSMHITHLTLSVQKPSSVLLAGFPECPQLRHIELPSPVFGDIAELLPVFTQSPNLQHLSISRLKVDATALRSLKKTQLPLSHAPLDTFNLTYIKSAKFLRALVSSIPTHTLSILFESENHASDLRNITRALFSESAVRRDPRCLKALYLERSGRNFERSTIEERNIAIETLREHCVRSNVELKYDFLVSLLFALFAGGWLIRISGGRGSTGISNGICSAYFLI